MAYKVGDKVKFLNQKGGGIVSKIVNSQIVNVSVEDGFDIPTLINELVLVETDEKAANLFQEDIQVGAVEKRHEHHEDADDYRVSKIAGNSAEAGMYLAFVPHDQRFLVSWLMDIYLINNTHFDILFSLFLRNEENTFIGTDYGGLEPRQKFLLKTIERDELNEWLTGVVQVLFHVDSSKQILNPLSSEFRIKPSRFYQENNYIAIPFIQQKSLMLTLGKITEISTFMENKDSIDKDELVLKPQKAKQIKSENILEQHLINSHTAEVDLHIGELADDYYLLSPAEMLNIQLDYFMKCMDAAITHHIQKIIFIHGVGNHVLKNEIKKGLSKYKSVHSFDASMAKDGMGATEVFIGQNAEITE